MGPKGRIPFNPGGGFKRPDLRSVSVGKSLEDTLVACLFPEVKRSQQTEESSNKCHWMIKGSQDLRGSIDPFMRLRKPLAIYIEFYVISFELIFIGRSEEKTNNGNILGKRHALFATSTRQFRKNTGNPSEASENMSDNGSTLQIILCHLIFVKILHFMRGNLKNQQHTLENMCVLGEIID